MGVIAMLCDVKAVGSMSTSAKLAAKVKADKDERPKAELKTTPEKQKVVNLQICYKTCVYTLSVSLKFRVVCNFSCLLVFLGNM